MTLQHHHSPKLGTSAVHHTPRCKHSILFHIIQGVIFSISKITHLISLRGAVYCSPQSFILKGLIWVVAFCDDRGIVK
jgi:hypothetical protein